MTASSLHTREQHCGSTTATRTATTSPPSTAIYLYPILEAVLSFLSALDASFLLAVLGLKFQLDWQGVVEKFTSPLRDLPEVAPWIATIIKNGHAAFLIGGDLNRWRYPLTTYDQSRSTLRLWLALRVRRDVDEELARRRESGTLRPFFIIANSGHEVYGPGKQARELMLSNNVVLTDSSLIPIPASKCLGPLTDHLFSDRTEWLETRTNEGGVQLVWARTSSDSRLPIAELCPTQWQDQRHENEGRDGWHWTPGSRCDRSAPGAVREGRRERRSVFSLPYLDLSTMVYSKSGLDNVDSYGHIVEPDNLALAVDYIAARDQRTFGEEFRASHG